MNDLVKQRLERYAIKSKQQGLIKMGVRVHESQRKELLKVAAKLRKPKL